MPPAKPRNLAGPSRLFHKKGVLTLSWGPPPPDEPGDQYAVISDSRTGAALATLHRVDGRYLLRREGTHRPRPVVSYGDVLALLGLK